MCKVTRLVTLRFLAEDIRQKVEKEKKQEDKKKKQGK